MFNNSKAVSWLFETKTTNSRSLENFDKDSRTANFTRWQVNQNFLYTL